MVALRNISSYCLIIKMIELCPDNILASSIFAADDLRSQTNWLPACAATTAPECKLHSHLFDKTNTADNDDSVVDDDNNVGDDDCDTNANDFRNYFLLDSSMSPTPKKS